VVIGLPVVLSLSAKLIVRLHWSLAFLIGAVLGVSALALLFIVFAGGWHQLTPQFKNHESLRENLIFVIAAVIIAGTAFTVYCGLVRSAMRDQQRKSGVPRGTPQFFSVLD
jgi:hypothetical protein